MGDEKDEVLYTISGLENDLKEKAEEIVVLTSKKDGLISDIHLTF
jgi:hypothetical protein